MAMSLRGIKDFPRSEVHQSVVGRRIACPYFKRSPQGAPRADSCFRNGFKDIHKMKEHLYRVHAIPAKCPRCYKAFSDDTELGAHLRAVGSNLCQPSYGHAVIEGYDQIQARKLSERMRGKSLIDKWGRIWKILFPSDADDLIPAPWWSPQHSLQRLEVSDYFSRYENFIRERLPVFFHSRVECLIDPTASEQLSGHMNEILRDCLEVTFAQFKDGEGAMLAGAAATATQATTTGAEQSNGLSQDVGRIFTELGSSEGRSVQSVHLNAFTPFEDVDMAAEEPVTIVQQGEHFTAGTVANTFGHQAFPVNGVFNSDLHIENMGYADPFLPASIMQTQKSWEFEVGNTDNSLWDGSILLQVEMLEEGSEAQ